jgi:hypothetical protein
MKEKFLTEINGDGWYVHYGEEVQKIRDLFSRKQDNLKNEDDKFFSKYWQVYAWAAIIGFLNNKRIEDAKLVHQKSIQFRAITNGSDKIANALVLMAIGKLNAKTHEEVLNIRSILTIISEYAEGGAKHILELRQTPSFESKFNYADDYFFEIAERTNAGGL